MGTFLSLHGDGADSSEYVSKTGARIDVPSTLTPRVSFAYVTNEIAERHCHPVEEHQLFISCHFLSDSSSMPPTGKPLPMDSLKE